MSDPFLGEIRLFGGNFAPVGWAFCDGATLPISENDALFTLIGTTYGGDGQQTFNLPDLRGRVPVHQGTSTVAGTTYTIGEMAGVEQVTLTTQQIPLHTHTLLGSTDIANEASPVGQVLATASTFDHYVDSTPAAAMAAQSISQLGGSQPHTNFQPYLCVNFIISLFGQFPSPT
jgi:microcystin-dependent protein